MKLLNMIIADINAKVTTSHLKNSYCFENLIELIKIFFGTRKKTWKTQTVLENFY